ncbi:MAG: GDSL-type esterase/lipase family protein [Myxococcota bacterium]
MQLYGRWDRSNPKAPRSSWNATYIETRFEGTEIAIRLRDGDNNWSYRIDDGALQTLVTTSAAEYLLGAGLSDTTHTLHIVRRGEIFAGQQEVVFDGFALGADTRLLAPNNTRTRGMEFIGDSISAGFGNEGFGNNDRSTQNANLAFGPVTARNLNADWHVEAISGIGMYRTLGDFEPPSLLTMPDHFLHTGPDINTTTWDFTWIPHVVVVELGTNDYIDSTGGPVNRSAFRGAYTNFLELLRDRYPVTHIFCLSPFFPAMAPFEKPAATSKPSLPI